MGSFLFCDGGGQRRAREGNKREGSALVLLVLQGEALFVNEHVYSIAICQRLRKEGRESKLTDSDCPGAFDLLVRGTKVDVGLSLYSLTRRRSELHDLSHLNMGLTLLLVGQT